MTSFDADERSRTPLKKGESTCEQSPAEPHKWHRDYQAEREAAAVALAYKVAAIREQAGNGTLDDDRWMHFIKVLLACPLPYRKTALRQITRRTRFGGKWVTLTYTACRPNVAMPFGADNKLMHWLFDRGLRQARKAGEESRVVPFNSTMEFLRDCGMSLGKANYQTAKDGFRRLTGLAITVVFEDENEECGGVVPLLDAWYLPKSIAGHEMRGEALSNEDRYAFVLSKPLYEHGKKYEVRFPRQLWRLLKGRPQKAAILLWMFTRAYAAGGKSKIKWDIVREQLWYDKANPRRVVGAVRDASVLLRTMWPGAGVRVEDDGVVFNKAQEYIFKDNPLRNRVRRVKSAEPAD